MDGFLFKCRVFKLDHETAKLILCAFNEKEGKLEFENFKEVMKRNIFQGGAHVKHLDLDDNS